MFAEKNNFSLNVHHTLTEIKQISECKNSKPWKN